MAEAREKARIGMAAGDEKYLPVRDKGPQKRFVRDYVDARTGVGEFMIPVMFLVIIVTLIPDPTVSTIALLVLWLFFLLAVIDSIILGFLVRKKLRAKFGEDRVESRVRWYAAMRALQLRLMRLPKPQVKRGHFPKLARARPAGDKGVVMQKVIVAVDGSPASLTALDWAIERSRHVDMSIELLAVLYIPDSAFRTETELRPHYEKTLQDAAEQVRRTAPRVKTTTRLLHGVPVNELVDASATASLLVAGSDKSSRLRGLVYGTLPLRLAALARCPLVVVPRVWKHHDASVMLAVGEEPAPEASDFAVEEATARGAVLELIHVWAASPIYPVPVAELHYPFTTIRDGHAQVLVRRGGAHPRRPSRPAVHDPAEGGPADPDAHRRGRARPVAGDRPHRQGHPARAAAGIRRA